MSLIRCFAPVLALLAVSLAPPRLFADAIASVTVETDTRGLPGGSSCKLTSSGAEIECTSGSTTMPHSIAVAEGRASAGVGSLNIFVLADGPYFARATATASYDYQVYFPSGYSGTVTGEYRLDVNTTLGGGAYGDDRISQGNRTVDLPVQDPAPFRNPILLTSLYVPGQPLEIQSSMNASALAYGEIVYASMTLIGFFDRAGNAIPFVVAPEPAGWPVLGLCLVLVWRTKRLI